MAALKALYTNDSGATGIEYGLIVSLIAMALFSAMGSLANETTQMFGYVEGEYTDSTGF